MFSRLDLKSGFWQIMMDEDSKQYTAFTLGNLGFFKCKRMPFGLCNAPASCLGELNITYCLIYLDNVIIYAKDEEEHLDRLRTVFERFRKDNLKLKPSKCNLFQKEITYLAQMMYLLKELNHLRPVSRQWPNSPNPLTISRSGHSWVWWAITADSSKVSPR